VFLTEGVPPPQRSSTTTSGSPVQLSVQVLHPAAAAVGEVLSLVDQALVQVAGEQRNAIGPRVVAKEMAGHADLVAAAGVEHLLIKPRPVPNRIKAGGLLPEDLHRHHGDCCGPSLIAGVEDSVVSARCPNRFRRCREADRCCGNSCWPSHRHRADGCVQ